MISKFYNLFKCPIFIFAVLVLLLTILLVMQTGFNFPELYIDKNLADKLAQTVTIDQVHSTIKHLINPKYKIYNLLFQFWGWFLTFFIFTIFFKIKHFADFKNLKILNNKLFIYIWINVSYLLFSIFFTVSFMGHLNNYVYHWTADSIGIPLLTVIFLFVFGIIIYYPYINILTYITYNTGIKNVFYQIVWYIGFIPILFFIFYSIDSGFTYINLILNFYYLMSLIFIIYSIGYLKLKK